MYNLDNYFSLLSVNLIANVDDWWQRYAFFHACAFVIVSMLM